MARIRGKDISDGNILQWKIGKEQQEYRVIDISGLRGAPDRGRMTLQRLSDDRFTFTTQVRWDRTYELVRH